MSSLTLHESESRAASRRGAKRAAFVDPTAASRFSPIAAANPNSMGRDDFMVWRAMEWCQGSDAMERVVTRSLGDVLRASTTGRGQDGEAKLTGDAAFSPPWFGNSVLVAAFLRAAEQRLLPRQARCRGSTLSAIAVEHRAQWSSIMCSILTSRTTPTPTLVECIDERYVAALVSSLLRAPEDDWRASLRELLQRVFIRCGPRARANARKAARYELVAFVHDGRGRSSGRGVDLDFEPAPAESHLPAVSPIFAQPAPRAAPETTVRGAGRASSGASTTREEVQPVGVAALISVLAGAVEGLERPLAVRHKEYLECVLMPLHGAQAVVLRGYHDALQFAMARYAHYDAECAVFIVNALATAWPTRSSTKACMLLRELEVLATVTDAEVAKLIARPILSVLARCIRSPHFLVALRALAFWENPDLVEWGVLAPKFDSSVLLRTYPALNESSQNHFHAEVRASAQAVIDSYTERNTMLVRSTHRRYLEAREGSALATAARQKKWDGLNSL